MYLLRWLLTTYFICAGPQLPLLLGRYMSLLITGQVSFSHNLVFRAAVHWLDRRTEPTLYV